MKIPQSSINNNIKLERGKFMGKLISFTLYGILIISVCYLISNCNYINYEISALKAEIFKVTEIIENIK